MSDSDIITATDLEATGYDVAWALALPLPTYNDADGHHYWLRADLDIWIDSAEGRRS